MNEVPGDRPGPEVAKLALGDPLRAAAAEDTAEAWGDRAESDLDKHNRYQAERPPHHGD